MRFRRFEALAMMIVAVLPIPVQADEEREWIAPPALQPGDTIALVAPSRSVAHRPLESYVASYESWGYHVKFADNLGETRGYLAGTDESRAAAFMNAWLDPEVRCVWPITGGYGTMRFLELLDYDAIRANPKVFIGMSDITGLHAAIGKETGLITFLGPNAAWPIIRNDYPPCEYARTWIWRAIGSGGYLDPTGALLPPGYTYTYPTEPRDPGQGDDVKAPPETLVPGVARGRLVGGNLSLISALVGTPWEIETEGRILVLEDVGERPYRIDRMLCQMQLAGMFDDLAGVALGTWRKCAPEEDDTSLTLREVLEDYFADAPYPVMLNFPTGHCPEQATLPLNALAELDATDCRLTLLENPATPRP
jgi:muramoyltetrapeptide carboxypeptidase